MGVTVTYRNSLENVYKVFIALTENIPHRVVDPNQLNNNDKYVFSIGLVVFENTNSGNVVELLSGICMTNSETLP